MSSQPRSNEVHDQSGFSYTLTKVLGQGGQGCVWFTNIPNVVIKTSMHNEELVRDPSEIFQYQERIKKITALPVQGLDQFSLPIAVLQDACGYVMRLMGSTSKLSNFMPNRFTAKRLQELLQDLPDWLEQQLEPIKENAPQQAALMESSFKRLALYAQTGGIRLRWQIVYEMADILSKLHARGMIFGDLSEGNVMLSSKLRKVWFIDVDNLCFQGSGSIVYTPGCCAPEVFRQEAGVTQQSDVYAFALLAFELLTMRHPFMSGRLVDEAAEQSEEQEQLANQGVLPWILESNDRSNALVQDDPILPYTLNHAIFKLFEQTFGVGRNNAAARPPLWMFKYAVKQAQYHSIVCPHCMMGFTYGENHIEDGKCPFCGAQLPLVLTLSYARKVLWAHELVDASTLEQTQNQDAQTPQATNEELVNGTRTQSLYQQLSFLNQLTLTLDLLDPDFGHKPNFVSTSLTLDESSFLGLMQRNQDTLAPSSPSQHNLVSPELAEISNPFEDVSGSNWSFDFDTKGPALPESFDFGASADFGAKTESLAELRSQKATPSVANERPQAQARASSDNKATSENQTASAKPTTSDASAQDNFIYGSESQAQAHKKTAKKSSASSTSNTGGLASWSKGNQPAASDIAVAHFNWINQTLSVYPEYAFQGKLEYALVPPNLEEILKDPMLRKLHKPHYEACPNGLEFSLEQLKCGICLRLPGKTQMVLQCKDWV